MYLALIIISDPCRTSSPPFSGRLFPLAALRVYLVLLTCTYSTTLVGGTGYLRTLLRWPNSKLQTHPKRRSICPSTTLFLSYLKHSLLLLHPTSHLLTSLQTTPYPLSYLFPSSPRQSHVSSPFPRKSTALFFAVTFAFHRSEEGSRRRGTLLLILLLFFDAFQPLTLGLIIRW